jgi:sulfide:quinone oxidoreductase
MKATVFCWFMVSPSVLRCLESPFARSIAQDATLPGARRIERHLISVMACAPGRRTVIATFHDTQQCRAAGHGPPAAPEEGRMAHIVIIGGGPNGLAMAYEMLEQTRAEDRITLVASGERLQASSGAPWNGAQPNDDARFALGEALEKKGIGFSAAGAQRLHPERNALELGDGTSLGYDYLVITTGPKPAFDEIEGLGPAGHTHSLCEAAHLQGCSRGWREFVDNPGPLVVGAVQGAACFAPAYESLFHMDADLRHRGLREKADITFVTAEPWIGHLGVGGMGDARERLEAQMRERGIAWIANARVDRVERARMHVSECDAAGAPQRQRVLPFRYAMMMPAFRGIDAVAGIEGLVNARGFILVDEHQRNPRFPNIFAAGATVEAASAAPTPVPTGTHKTTYMVESMVSTTAQNIRDQLDGRAPSQRATWRAVSLADLGAGGLAFVADEAPPPRPIDWFKQGDWVQLSRCSVCNVGD